MSESTRERERDDYTRPVSIPLTFSANYFANNNYQFAFEITVNYLKIKEGGKKGARNS